MLIRPTTSAAPQQEFGLEFEQIAKTYFCYLYASMPVSSDSKSRKTQRQDKASEPIHLL